MVALFCFNKQFLYWRHSSPIVFVRLPKPNSKCKMCGSHGWKAVVILVEWRGCYHDNRNAIHPFDGIACYWPLKLKTCPHEVTPSLCFIHQRHCLKYKFMRLYYVCFSIALWESRKKEAASARCSFCLVYPEVDEVYFCGFLVQAGRWLPGLWSEWKSLQRIHYQNKSMAAPKLYRETKW